METTLSNNKKTRVVVIGGGNGSAVIINALKQHRNRFAISAVVSVSDSGGSSGRLREELGVLPPGDILRAILAMSPYDYRVLKQIFYRNRFTGAGKLDGHDLGNIFLALAEKYGNNYLSAVHAFEQAVEAIGHVFPSTLEKTNLVVELSNGLIIKGEAAIDRPTHDRVLRIQKAWLEPTSQAYEGACEVIKKAEVIILSPGSLYTSLIATLLPTGIHEAIQSSHAKLLYISGSAYEREGETGPEKLSEFVRELQRYVPRHIDLVIPNVHTLNAAGRQKYQEKKWAEFVNDKENIPEYTVMNMEYKNPEGDFDIERLGTILCDVIFNEHECYQCVWK
ncbi:YvcK family protein [Candidatus Uhrbacteria bacterium]|nr:YvcK family protein [Candidatus Uhrbacteria bacterium]